MSQRLPAKAGFGQPLQRVCKLNLHVVHNLTHARLLLHRADDLSGREGIEVRPLRPDDAGRRLIEQDTLQRRAQIFRGSQAPPILPKA